MVSAKIYILDFGRAESDPSWFIYGANIQQLGLKKLFPGTIRTAFIGALIIHPSGNILFDTGPHPEAKKVWPKELYEALPIVEYGDQNKLENILNIIGLKIEDIDYIIMSHLHLDHTGGLHLFRDTGTPIYVHEKEIKHAYYSVTTKTDPAYLAQDLDVGLNWKPWHGEKLEIFEDVFLYHTPGHTAGHCSMRIKLEKTGNIIFTADLCHLKENFENEIPLGWLMTDRTKWLKSLRKLKLIAEKYKAVVVYGHDAKKLEELKRAPFYYE